MLAEEMGVDDERRPGGESPAFAAPEEGSGEEFVVHPQAGADPREAELSGVRIAQIAALRRGAYRSRSHAIIAAAVALVMACQLVFSTIEHLLAGDRLFAVITAVIALLLFGCTFWLIRLAVRLHRQAQPPPLAEPPLPPDFSPLSDGSQRWKNLEKIE